MSRNGEDLLKQAYQKFQSGDFRNAFGNAKEARKKFEKEGMKARALEALRVMADSTLNSRKLKEAKSLYEELVQKSAHIPQLQAGAYWGLGEVASFNMNYALAANHFANGLSIARSVADKWFIAWNTFGLGKAYRGLGKLDNARSVLPEAESAFEDLGHSTYVTWVKRLMSELDMDSKAPPSSGELRIWLCPMCGSKFNQEQASHLARGKMTSCEYCGTTVG